MARLNPRIDRTAKRETVVELTAQHHLADDVVVQPDFQYVLNPGAIGPNRDAVVGGLRIMVLWSVPKG